MKWLFLIGLVLSAPITFNQFVEENGLNYLGMLFGE